MLYTRNGSWPAPLPASITLSNGFIRTDTASFTAGEIADAGYVVAPDAPAYDPATEHLGWDGAAWTVTALPPPTEEQVDAERDRRISAGFVFAGVIYQSRPEDRENIMGAGTAALGAMVQGALPGDLRWHGGDSDFAWIAADNSLNPMDAQTVYAFGLAAMAHKTAHIFAARAIKDADPVSADFADNVYWP
ncbi:MULTISPECIES: DUF4376 domain-containing protein [unclassified Shinella]|jgi:hypothetical protein|uniref:DUF4376 domain-containing protein n=1 Tax=unclassified Shinella TaxID=2643062 RepID=UPI00234E3E03|nr:MULTISPECIES: DUF4376 domain-containing protein [unclassified Shinella]MCO5152603.1 DUF4376 domain-containing protein [Shinella sp.]MDC7261898.1 DUF4376 domain-containing protein [Shinella sp. HY16]MDC7268793.1 DUF4376 domain-containing protein [Shinella sp. YZ44]